MEAAKREKQIFDMQAIRERLNTYIDLKNYRVSEEMIDMFVERVIYRRVVNLTGDIQTPLQNIEFVNTAKHMPIL